MPCRTQKPQPAERCSMLVIDDDPTRRRKRLTRLATTPCAFRRPFAPAIEVNFQRLLVCSKRCVKRPLNLGYSNDLLPRSVRWKSNQLISPYHFVHAWRAI